MCAVLEKLRGCLVGMKKDHASDEAKWRTAASTLAKYIGNVCAAPGEEKFRWVRQLYMHCTHVTTWLYMHCIHATAWAMNLRRTYKHASPCVPLSAHRTIKTTNVAFQSRVAGAQGGVEFLELCGFGVRGWLHQHQHTHTHTH